MLSQIQFKLNVEEQYLKGVEKMVQLYDMEGDRKSKGDAAARRVESKQKIVLLKQALKRYEELHIDLDSSDAQDGKAEPPQLPASSLTCSDTDLRLLDDSINMPNLRKPLSGQLTLRVLAVKDVDHATSGRFSRGPETFVAVKVEDTVMARTRTSRNDRWEAEYHTIDVEKANEIELTAYDKPGEHPMPIAMLWVRVSDIVEEMRRKRIEAEMNSSGWVSADQMGNPSASQTQLPMSPSQTQFGGAASPTGPPGQNAAYGTAGPQPQVGTNPIDGWFNLEPAGQIRLQMSFIKQNKDQRQVDVGLGRKGAVRQRKEEVHEMYGHKFVQHQFYNIMRCALCGDFLKYSAGMQCEDCKYTCHTKCYSSVVTKCISKSNAETDPDEEKINHRIPHRFQPFSNMTANWCCHCGYILPFGKKNCRKCSGNAFPRPQLIDLLDQRADALQNAALQATPNVFILCPTFVECQWLWPTRFWRASGLRSKGKQRPHRFLIGLCEGLARQALRPLTHRRPPSAHLQLSTVLALLQWRRQKQLRPCIPARRRRNDQPNQTGPPAPLLPLLPLPLLCQGIHYQDRASDRKIMDHTAVTTSKIRTRRAASMVRRRNNADITLPTM